MLAKLVSDAPPERPAIGAVCYGELYARAQAFAAGMRGIDKLGVALEPADAVAALVGANLAGVEPCLYPPELDASRLDSLAQSFGHEHVLVSAPFEGAAVSQLTPAELRDAASEPVPAPDPDAPAPVLILTTGTTGAPKGARHDWRRLLGGVHVPSGVEEPRWLLAFNLNQFAGIQVLLHALASAGSLVVPASRRPADVAAAIAEHGVTHASGTPTFWRLLSRELDPQSAAQLPLAQITLGGEAASDQLLSALRELFPQARISHVYAGTEVGSVVSVSDGRAGLPVSLLEGDGSAHASFKIVDGELHVRSDVGMLGYQAGADDAAGWRATGDQVEVRDGRIQFVGRSSEIINVGGAKVHPLPVEQLIGSVPGVQIAAVYGRPSPITGQIVSADVVAAPGHDVQALEAEIRQACEALPAAGRPRRIRFVDQVQTRGHKVVRQ